MVSVSISLPEGSRPRTAMTNGALSSAKADLGHSMNLAKLYRMRALRWELLTLTPSARAAPARTATAQTITPAATSCLSGLKRSGDAATLLSPGRFITTTHGKSDALNLWHSGRYS